MITDLPRAAQPLVAFPSLLRSSGFHVSAEQTIGFLEGVRLVGPASIQAIRHAAHACFAPHFERRGEFDALFRAHFEGQGDLIALPGEEQQEFSVRDNSADRTSEPQETGAGESGKAASASELLFVRTFGGSPHVEHRHTLREIARCLPNRRGFRLRARSRGHKIYMSRSMARMVRCDGDMPKPALRDRRIRQRRVLLLIDISGSMKEWTRDYLRFAHMLRHAVDQVEVFTLGTRLTRITRALAHRREGVALARVADAVVDWDGGTRLGQAMAAFICDPRYINFARGAVVLVLSDGLERDDPAALIAATRRISQMAWRLSWATPLAGDPRYRPETAALKAMLPLLDDLVDGSTPAALAELALRLAKTSPSASEIWSGKGTRP